MRLHSWFVRVRGKNATRLVGADGCWRFPLCSTRTSTLRRVSARCARLPLRKETKARSRQKAARRARDVIEGRGLSATAALEVMSMI